MQSEKLIKIMPALLASQKSIHNARKDSKNPFFKSEYASLGAVIEASKDELNKNGITVLQPLTSDEHGEYVETTLIHESGEWISSRLRIKNAKPNDPQAQGSAITYARRYSLMSLLCLDATDDDAESAVARNTDQPATDDQIKTITKLMAKGHIPKHLNTKVLTISAKEASAWINEGVKRSRVVTPTN